MKSQLLKALAVGILMLGCCKVQATDSTLIHNPMLWADCPDPDVIRVGDTFYLVSTTMHLMPGAPVMASKDLKNWETVGYIFDRLTDSPKYDLQEGTVYGRGQWATSLKYHDGRFWALLAPNEGGPMGDTYIFTAPKAVGPWTIHSRLRHFHDATLFFDDDGTPYVFFGTGEMCQLTRDLKGVVEGSLRHYFQREADERGLLEGTRVIKHEGTYYALLISHVYAPGRHRREVCYRTRDLNGPWEKKVILESDFGGFPYVGQGTIVDGVPAADGSQPWYGIIFQDRGGVGRVLTLMPCRWTDGWPMLGDEEGRVPAKMEVPAGSVCCDNIATNGTEADGTTAEAGKPAAAAGGAALTRSDDFGTETLGLHWQWNHNPVEGAWSLKERRGFLRLTTSGVTDNLYLAPNTLTQRMEGPACSGVVCLDVSQMKDGDCAGLAAFNGDSGVLTVKREGNNWVLTMSEQSVRLTDREKAVTGVEEKVQETVPLAFGKGKSLASGKKKGLASGKVIYLRVDGDFRVNRDAANFFYSLDGREWTAIGSRDYKMRFDYRRLFMGTKFAIFCYATKEKGGYIDVDRFDYTLERQ